MQAGWVLEGTRERERERGERGQGMEDSGNGGSTLCSTAVRLDGRAGVMMRKMVHIVSQHVCTNESLQPLEK